MSYGKKLQLLYELRCKTCNKHFLYCSKSGRDFRCDKCKNAHGTLADVEKELKEMSNEERLEFEKEIQAYEKENGKLDL